MLQHLCNLLPLHTGVHLSTKSGEMWRMTTGWRSTGNRITVGTRLIGGGSSPLPSKINMENPLCSSGINRRKYSHRLPLWMRDGLCDYPMPEHDFRWAPVLKANSLSKVMENVGTVLTVVKIETWVPGRLNLRLQNGHILLNQLNHDFSQSMYSLQQYRWWYEYNTKIYQILHPKQHSLAIIIRIQLGISQK